MNNHYCLQLATFLGLKDHLIGCKNCPLPLTLPFDLARPAMLVISKEKSTLISIFHILQENNGLSVTLLLYPKPYDPFTDKRQGGGVF